MKKFTAWMEEHFVPIAAKIGSQKHLVAIRDSFISTMPVTMAGSVAVLLNALVRDLPNEYGWFGETNPFDWLIGINGNVWWGTLAVLSLVLVISVGYNFAKAYDVDPIAGALIAFAAYISVLPQGIPETWGNIDWNFTNSTAMFAALIVGMVSTIIYAKLMQANIIIKLPDEVPPAVSRAFAAIIPGLVAIYLASSVQWAVASFTDFGSVPNLINQYVQKPFMDLSQNIFSIVIVTALVSVFWFFGLHGPNVLAAPLDGIYKPALVANLEFYETNKTIQGMPHIWTRGSFDAFSWMGGSGSTFALIVAILVLSKRADERAVAKYSLPMGLFNINEPVLFGLPIVLNPVYFLPFVLVPVIQVLIAYAVTAAGLVPPVYLEVPWVLPPVIYAFLATGFSVSGALLALFNIGVGIVIWGAFVLVASTMDPEEA